MVVKDDLDRSVRWQKQPVWPRAKRVRNRLFGSGLPGLGLKGISDSPH
jgi:hypothetical protein